MNGMVFKSNSGHVVCVQARRIPYGLMVIVFVPQPQRNKRSSEGAVKAASKGTELSCLAHSSPSSSASNTFSSSSATISLGDNRYWVEERSPFKRGWIVVYRLKSRPRPSTSVLILGSSCRFTVIALVLIVKGRRLSSNLRIPS